MGKFILIVINNLYSLKWLIPKKKILHIKNKTFLKQIWNTDVI